jgi:hypothetical protein
MKPSVPSRTVAALFVATADPVSGRAVDCAVGETPRRFVAAMEGRAYVEKSLVDEFAS